MTDQPTGSELARLVSTSAHGLRNHVATMRSVVQLVDDPEVADALRTSVSAVQVAIERHVALARVLLEEVPSSVELEAGDLLRLAGQRARREGGRSFDDVAGDGADVVVRVPGTWAERVLADLLHAASEPPAVGTDGDEVVVAVSLVAPLGDVLAEALRGLAVACGGSLDVDEAAARLRLPVSR